MLARNVEVMMNREGIEYPFSALDLRTFTENPAIVGNFESSMADPHSTTPAFNMRFSVDKAFLPALKNAGFTHLSLANNHSLDYGESGYLQAKDKLADLGLGVFGHGKALSNDSISYVETKRGKIALIGINASEQVPSYEDLEIIFTIAKKESYLQIVYIHWGIEYDENHHPTQEVLAKKIIEAGADLIVGHHPHVVQDIDIIDNVIVFYSLGNYIFDQYFSKNVQEGLVVLLSLEENPQLQLIPVTSHYALSKPSLMVPAEHQLFLQLLASRSHQDLRESILKGVIPLEHSVATSTEIAIMVQ
jgi:poly-gamma-glutamate synthesis protein (capsule biosynthesis protein)